MNTPNSTSSWRDNSNLNDSTNDYTSNPLHFSSSSDDSLVSPSQRTPEEDKTVARPRIQVKLKKSNLTPSNLVESLRQIFEPTNEQCHHRIIMSALPEAFQLKCDPDDKIVIQASLLADQLQKIQLNQQTLADFPGIQKPVISSSNTTAGKQAADIESYNLNKAFIENTGSAVENIINLLNNAEKENTEENMAATEGTQIIYIDKPKIPDFDGTTDGMEHYARIIFIIGGDNITFLQWRLKSQNFM